MSLNLIKAMFKLTIAAMLACVVACVASVAAFSRPILQVNAPQPDAALPGEQLRIPISVENIGDEKTSGPIVLKVTGSSGLGPAFYTGQAQTSTYQKFPESPTNCEASGATLTCTTTGWVPPGGQWVVETRLPMSSEATGSVSTTISASGGGMQGATVLEHEIKLGPPLPFGFDQASARLLNPDRSQANQAASVPADFTTYLEWPTFNSQFLGFVPEITPSEHVKRVVAHLPPGLIGNPSATTALCTADQLAEPSHAFGAPDTPNCPQESQVGVVRVFSIESGGLGKSKIAGLFNMQAPPGFAAELGFQMFETEVHLKAYVRPGDHGIDIVSDDTTTSLPFGGAEITVWGNPYSPSHDGMRGACLESLYIGANGLSCPSVSPEKAFLRTPTSCSGDPLAFGAESNSYEKEGTFVKASFTGPTMVGCESVPFSPSILVEPTSTATNSPTGLVVKLSLPQTQSPEGLAEADLKKAVVTLPEGMAIDPSSADGLQACDDAHLHLDSNTPAECPNGSKIGTVLLHTQLIPNPIEGSIYLRPQSSSDPMSGEMFRLALELRDDPHGLDFKLAGHVQANPATGRLTTTFDDNPQLPFEDIELNFKSGARAPLATPSSCRTQTTEADFYSWAQPDTAVHQASSFAISSGADGTPCQSPLGFAPAFNAGVTNVEAGAFTSFLSTFSRKDSDQGIQRVSVQMPKGLSGSLIGLPLCEEAQANAGACSSASQIGTTTAGAGAGPTPFYVTGGRVYMTGPYEGAPFGLSIVVPTKAGPFDLGTVVVRAKVEVDPHTAQLTVTTDPLPKVVGGVPVDLRLVNVTINRPAFVFNPTNCASAQISGSMTGAEGGTAALSKAFQVTNCAALKFHPKFTVSTSAKSSRGTGASLDAKLSYPLGHTVNIAKVKVELPKQLPSRLTTLQKACPAETFETNPAACPVASRVGIATATTPVLPVTLTGPAYFVSHGGQAFPDLTIVLQGYGVTVDLAGTTFISKAGITSTTFKQVPDMPVGSFELRLPQGPDSALAANGNLCARKLTMPTTFVAQDGMEIHTPTPIAVSHCGLQLHVVSHRVKGSRVTVVVRVPSAGRLSANGAGLSQAGARAKRAETVKLRLSLLPAQHRLLSSHPGRRLKVTVKLAFTSARGVETSSAFAVLMR